MGSDEQKPEAFDSAWTWLVATYQGKRVAFKANLTDSVAAASLKPTEMPTVFEVTKMTHLTFSPPNKFGAMAFPEEAFAVVNPRGWMQLSELSQLRFPSPELQIELEKAWVFTEESPIEQNTDVAAAAKQAAATRTALQRIRGGK